MRIRGLASKSVSRIVPTMPAILRKGDGYETAEDGSRTPLYTESRGRIRVEGVPNDTLWYANDQGFQGVLRAVYLDGDWHGNVKADRDGGDTMIFDGHEWLVVQVQETWSTWSKVLVCQQS